MPEIIIKPGREKSILRRHPWIFSGAISKVIGSPKNGETVDVTSSLGDFLARAAYNPYSNIIARIWSWDQNERVDLDMFESRVKQSIELRRMLVPIIKSDAMRLVHAESDGLPGLILDTYADSAVVQFLTAGVEYWRDALIDIILRTTRVNLLYERSDLDVRQLEGLPKRCGVLLGQEPRNPIIIADNENHYYVDIIDGHKTGFYLDQRENRIILQSISDGLDVLDCFSYTGGFAMNALAGKAKSVTLVDSSSTALALARENISLNHLDTSKINYIEKDVFFYLRELRDKGKTFDMVVLDPPKFAPTAAQAQRATRGYKDINMLALKILRPKGYLITFSCSGGVDEELFQKIVAGAALDAQVDAKILRRFHQSADHPVALNFPEGAYLKGFLIQKD